MQMQLIEISDKKPVRTLYVVRNFRKVIESKDISNMTKELYDFLNLYCGFIAHYDINGFKSVYSPPKEFADVFIRHFDSNHRYFSNIYPCHEEPYKDTGFTKANIKREFSRIVDMHKESISKWAETKQRSERYAVFKILKEEFQGELKGLKINCEACGKNYDVRVQNEGQEFTDFKIICCIFCGQQIKLY